MPNHKLSITGDLKKKTPWNERLPVYHLYSLYSAPQETHKIPDTIKAIFIWIQLEKSQSINILANEILFKRYLRPICTRFCGNFDTSCIQISIFTVKFSSIYGSFEVKRGQIQVHLRSIWNMNISKLTKLHYETISGSFQPFLTEKIFGIGLYWIKNAIWPPIQNLVGDRCWPHEWRSKSIAKRASRGQKHWAKIGLHILLNRKKPLQPKRESLWTFYTSKDL